MFFEVLLSESVCGVVIVEEESVASHILEICT